MADARSLLRQQRAARRIQHPHAAYSEAGKLLCTLCRQQVKAEGLWEKHLLSDGHKERLLLRVREGEEKDAVVVAAAPAPAPASTATANPTLKRRLDQSDALDDKQDDQDNHPAEDTLRRKRSKMDVVSPVDALRSSVASPPSLTRRHSTTPSQGVELQIPSRPATPSHRDTPSSTASGAAASRRRAGSNLTPTATPQVDESEWAAFEADVAPDAAQYDQDAVISAPVMTADESAAAAAAAAASENLKSEGKTKADADIEDERDEAARAMEDELQDMHELEERVKRLKDKRDALRKRSDSQAKDQSAPDGPTQEHGTGADDETLRRGDVVSQRNVTLEEEDDDDDDDDDDEDEDDWDGFRFHNS
ncbi:Zinc finger protein [Ophiocordyceps camponoti-floridani]|uniref:Zinc finger protein n=1 Tax=Ophiocordyceps camponoti-floridani TaxID=2030778 RepID=A0A8H4QDV7_9HYPO|nr:Zinc finger protein [Ophiocordyceps camponoti-floridani]